MSSNEDKLLKLKLEIGVLISSFECETEVRVESLELDNRVRGLAGCGENHIIICADVVE